MIYRKFGKTGLAMPVLSCGLMRSMFSWQDMPGSSVPALRQQELAAVVEAALKSGIVHLETARGYGSSERQLGPILADYDRDSYILQTKVRLEDDPELFTAHVLDSLDRLGQKRVDLLGLHGINDHRSLWQACRPGGCLAAARRLQAQGKVGWIGFSGHADLQVILSAIGHDGDGGFDYVNLHWYTIWQRNGPALAAAAERDMGVFIISPTDKGGRLQNPPALLCRASAPLTPMQFNDLFCLQRPEIHTISVGPACPEDFIAHREALARLEDRQLVQDTYRTWLQLMERRCAVSRPDALWHALPPWQQNPGYMNIGFILWLYNLARGWDLLEYARSRYRRLGRDMPWVAGNDAAAVRRYDLDNIAARVDMSGSELTELLQNAHALLGREQPGYSLGAG